MTPTHTPGPWHVITATGDYRHITITANVLGGDAVAIVATDFEGATIETVEANARLISAAPDLLAALEDMTAWLETYAKMKPAALDGAIGVSLIAARAALAKARQ